MTGSSPLDALREYGIPWPPSTNGGGRGREWPGLEHAEASSPTRNDGRTLADISDEPPRPLLLGMLEPDGPTLAYGAPGTGKGTTGAWIVVECLQLGMKPLIFDAERRPREWARRVSGLGGDRSRVAYREPTDLGKFAGRPFWEAGEELRHQARAAGADLLIVDSILPAVGLGEDRLKSDPQTPYLYVAALDALGIPTVSFGHPPKGQPEGDPFGSVAWLGAMRLTWVGTPAEGDGHRVRWRPRKRNERGYIPGFVLSVAYGADGRPSEVRRDDDEESTREWLVTALGSGAPRSVADMADELIETSERLDEHDAARVRERLSKSLQRMKRDNLVERLGTTGVGVRWQLALPR